MDNEIKQNIPVKATLHKDSNIDALRLDQAWEWLCESRKTAPANADIWDLRHRWSAYRETFLRQLQSGDYRLSPMLVVGSRRQAMWSAEDVLALKWVALAVTEYLPLHEKCEHVKGHGGGKSSIQRVSQNLTDSRYRWVCRTDIKGYYGAINKDTLLSQLRQYLTRPIYLNILTQYIHFSVEDGGEFHTPAQGIARGCALSPLMGALHLWAVDNFFAQQKKCYYGRYMDDFVILTRSRWQLRKQVKHLNEYLASLGFQKHPDKTFIGKVSKGFDWLGAWLTDKGITGVAPRALANHLEKVRRLYEQTRHWPAKRQARRVSDYCSRWKIWAVCIIATPGVHAASVAPGDTLRFTGTWTFDATGPTASSLTYTNVGVGFVISPGGSSGLSLCRLASSFPLQVTSDGYYGVNIGKDIVLGLSGSASGPSLPKGEIAPLATWSDNGEYNPVKSNTNGYTWCGQQTTDYISAKSGTTTFSGSWFIHAGPNAVTGTYSYRGLDLSRLTPSNWTQPPKTKIAPAGTIDVGASLTCTVTTPQPTVPFGAVAARPGEDMQVLADYRSSINVSCTDVNPGDVNNAKITFTTSTPGRYTDTVALSDGAGTSLAELRGVMKAGPGTCDNDPDRIQFGAAYQYPVEIKEGTVPFPVTWYLCSNGSNAWGEGSAKVTVTLTWP